MASVIQAMLAVDLREAYTRLNVATRYSRRRRR